MKISIPLLSASLILGCAGFTQNPSPACRTMEVQLKEKKELDAKVKITNEDVKKYRKMGDTASSASAERRLEGMLQNQRLLKESLDQSSRDCSPTAKDPMPVRDPASHDNLPK